MRRATTVLALLSPLLLASTLALTRGGQPNARQTTAALPIDESPERSHEAFQAFLEEHDDAIEEARRHLVGGRDLSTKQRDLLDEFDRLAAQKDAAWSHLYWYTDLDEALNEADRTGKPVLSLRLLGRLDEEMSCANSRFFRSILYSNEKVSATMRERYVLHWSSERPAPRITIDFGDGRVRETTITGNSMHVVLDNKGFVIDVIPGLMGPTTFIEQLESGAESALQTPEMNMAQSIQVDAAESRFGVHLADGVPNAIDAGVLTTSKFSVEGLMLGAVTTDVPVVRVGRRADADTMFDERSMSLMRAQRADETEEFFAEAMSRFAFDVSRDAVQNTTQLQPQARGFIRDANFGATPEQRLDALSNLVYTLVFRTPREDPYLGLFDDNAFDAQWHD